RPRWEGGGFDGSEEERRRLLTDAYTLGAEYVDVEWRARFDELVSRGGGRRIVLSSHDFDGVAADLPARVQAMRATGAEIVKIAAATARLSDCIPLHQIGAQAGRQGGLVVIAMGEAGLGTRVLAKRFGSMWTYAGGIDGIGQLTVSSMLDEFGFRRLTDATDIYGVVGRPVMHSMSPVMHNAAFAAARFDAVYLPFAASDAD